MPTSTPKLVTCIGRQMHATPGVTRCFIELSYLKLIKKHKHQEANVIRHHKQKACHLESALDHILGP